MLGTVIECSWAQCHPVFRQIPWKAIWMWTLECELRYRSTNESEIDLDLNECEHFLNVKLDRGSINVGSIYINIFMYHKRYEQLYDLGMCKDWALSRYMNNRSTNLTLTLTLTLIQTLILILTQILTLKPTGLMLQYVPISVVHISRKSQRLGCFSSLAFNQQTPQMTELVRYCVDGNMKSRAKDNVWWQYQHNTGVKNGNSQIYINIVYIYIISTLFC